MSVKVSDTMRKDKQRLVGAGKIKTFNYEAFSFTKLSKYLYAQIKSDFGGPSSGNRLVYGRAGNAAEVNDSKSLVAAVRKLHVYDGEIKVLLVCRLVEDDNEEDRRV